MKNKPFEKAYQVIDVIDGVIDGNTLVFNEDAKVVVKYHHTTKLTDVKYIIKKDVKVTLIEFNQLENFKRNVEIERNGSFNNLIIFDGNNELKIEENFYLKENANVKLAYADFNLGKVSSKNNYFLEAINADLLVNMGIVAKQKAIKDYAIVAEHKDSITKAQIINHGLVIDESKIKMDITGTINRGCKNTDSQQKSRMMIIDSEGKAEVNPKLLIDENEVVASHGASVGQLDKEQLFYLQTRGLSEQTAKKLIISGYLLPLVDNINDQKINEWFGLLIDEIMN